MRKLIDLAVLMEAPNLLVVSGVLTPEISYEDARRRFEDAIWTLYEDARAKDVGLGIENVWGKFLYSPVEMRDFVDRFADRHVGVHFDVGNVLQYGYPDQWIRTLGARRLLNIHLKDYLESINNIRGFTHLFQGDVPWARVATALQEVGYDGYLIAEVPPYPFCPEQGIRDTARKMDILVDLTAGDSPAAP
jgi:hexulose-6-phosphate isomerase